MNAGASGCAEAAALLGSEVVAMDASPARVTQLYGQVRSNQSSILPLVMDFVDPTPARGLFGHWAIAATDRFRSDMVIALDLVRHTALTRHLDFMHIAGGLALFSRRWLLVEFAAIDDFASGDTLVDTSWYTLDNFIGALRAHFSSIDVLPLSPGLHRLLLCEK
jgi:hypothetical protein